MPLDKYRARRDFSQTDEPDGGRRHGHRQARPPVVFVVQKHAARRLHYDFRLEMDGVLKSWAVPKGIPLARGEKSLAVQVEDHPLEYGGFEGTIPAGNYGAGTVLLWDCGNYEVENGPPAGSMRRGRMWLNLHGIKLRGHWVLSRMQHKEGGGNDNWLLIKTTENAPAVSSRSDNTSVLSGRSFKQLAEGRKVSRVREVRRAKRMPAKPARARKIARAKGRKNARR